MPNLGIDLGGTKIEAVLLADDGQIIERKRIPTKSSDGYDAIITRITNLSKELLPLVENIDHIGICTPGAIEPTKGVLKNSNTICLIGKPLQEDLEKQIGLSVFMENDANCFALSEASFGAAQGYNVVFGVIMGTGIGGGIVINKKIHSGPNNIAGEWGHHSIYPNGRMCYCGNKGCVETYISGPALEKEWFELTGENQIVTDILKNGLLKKHPEWKERFIFNFGRALSHVIDIVDPDCIVLGGGLSKVDMLYSEGRDAVYTETFSEHIVTPILKNKLGDSAGVFGAVLLGNK